MAKVRIKKLPSMEQGGTVRRTLNPVKRTEANIEAEKDEIIAGKFNGDENLHTMKVGGKKHSQGGTPLFVPDASFVFSDSKDIKLSGDILQEFGKSSKDKKKYTPADIAKKYDVSKYQNILDDPDADPHSKNTAEIMVANYKDKLAKLAMVQEETKGFPNGLPSIAQAEIPEMEMGGFVNPFDNDLEEFADGGNTNKKPWNQLSQTEKERFKALWENNSYQGPSENVRVGNEQGLPGRTFKRPIKDNQPTTKNFDYLPGSFNPRPPDNNTYINPTELDQVTITGTRPKPLGKPNSSESSLRTEPIKQAPSLPEFANQGIPELYGPDIISGQTTKAVSDPLERLKNQDSGIAESKQDTTANKDQGYFDSQYMTPDIRAMRNALGKRLNIDKTLPYYATPEVFTPDATFVDPGRELSANSEQAYLQMIANNQFSGAQARRANASSIQGVTLGQNAETMGRYNEMNTQIGNQNEAITSQIMTQDSMNRADIANKMYQGNTIADQQFKNAKDAADTNLLNTRASAWNNRTNLNMTNAVNKYYQIDPTTGAVLFDGGESLKSGLGSQSNETYQQTVSRFMTEEGMDKDTANEMAKKVFLERRKITSSNDGSPNKVVTTKTATTR